MWGRLQWKSLSAKGGLSEVVIAGFGAMFGSFRLSGKALGPGVAFRSLFPVAVPLPFMWTNFSPEAGWVLLLFIFFHNPSDMI